MAATFALHGWWSTS
ncbi:trp operon leader peptide [Salmonella enterica subsp. enterica serovar Kentucky]|nr:trp operon leader peptide [Salmonella enterica]EJR7966682.1 trp operon leader peptide [Salmonella enterica subsp. enterica serovar Kentucky]EKS6986836.1 trp operon leader peptide [Salmonella enterica subsp. enterica serovar Kentucky]ELR3784764.1 trp operon leader peptide [Salmonella enterica subsp. enterica serovar Kentucky]